MPPPEEVVLETWKRANGRCECKKGICSHVGRCNKELRWSERGLEIKYGWEIQRINQEGPNSPKNYEIICQDCYENQQR